MGDPLALLSPSLSLMSAVYRLTQRQTLGCGWVNVILRQMVEVPQLHHLHAHTYTHSTFKAETS